MTEEQIGRIKRLQSIFSAKIKEWKDNDLCYCSECGHLVLTYYNHSQRCPAEPLWIPQPIDWQNPERGLWGMLKETHKLVKLVNKEFSCETTLLHAVGSYKAIQTDDPFTALLEALCEQEGV